MSIHSYDSNGLASAPPARVGLAEIRTSSEDRFIELSEVLFLTSLGRTLVYQLMKESRFPTPVKIGKASRWVLSEVHGWLRERMLERA